MFLGKMLVILRLIILILFVFQEKSMGMWEQGITLPAKEVKNVNGMLSGTCPGLVEGNEYVFRIKAVNKDSKGRKCPSLPSPQSESMIAKVRFSMFYVARTTFKVILSIL